MRALPKPVADASFEQPVICVFALNDLTGNSPARQRALHVLDAFPSVQVQIIKEWVTAQDIGMSEMPSVAVISRGKVIDILAGECGAAYLRSWLVATCATQVSIFTNGDLKQRFSNSKPFQGFPCPT